MGTSKKTTVVSLPDLEAGMHREGSEEGPTVRFDPERRQNFHLRGDGCRVYHRVPDGWQFKEDGSELEPVPPAA